MDNTYRPSPRYVSGDPYHALAALAIANITERDDRRPARRRRTKRNPLAGRDRVRRAPRGVELPGGHRPPRAVRTRLRTRRSVEPPVHPAAGRTAAHTRRPARRPGEYLTIDHWASEVNEAFKAFIAHHRNEYDALDVELHALTTSETLMGRGISVRAGRPSARRRSTHPSIQQDQRKPPCNS